MDALAEEISSIRSVQRDLERRFDRLSARIDTVDAAVRSRQSSQTPRSFSETPSPRIPAATAPPKPLSDQHRAALVPPPLPADPKPAPPSASPRNHAVVTESFEMRFGQVWLVRIGVVILLTGLVFLGNYAYHELVGRIGAPGKLALLSLAGGALAVLGWRLQMRAAFRSFGRVLLGGGLATLYYTTYAAHFVPTLRVISSPLVAGAMLLALGGAFVWLADRVRSGLLAGTTLALAFYTAAINPVGHFSLFSNLVISVAGIVLLARRHWSGISILTLVGTYGSCAFWRFHQSGSFVAAQEPAAFLPAILFPAAYWAVHTAAVLWRRTAALDPGIRPVYLTVNNAAFFALSAPVIESRHPGSLWLCALMFGLVLVGLGVAAARTAPDEPVFDGSYLTQGLGLLFAASIFKLAGWTQPVAFALFAGTLLGISRLRHGEIFRLFAAIAAIIASATAVGGVASGGEHAQTVAAACAVLLVANGRILRVRKDLLTKSGVDPEVAFHIVLGCALAILAASFGNPSDTGLRLLGIGVAAALSLGSVRLPELVWCGQIIALLGEARLSMDVIIGNEATPLWPIAAACILVAWWQRRAPLAPAAARWWQAVHCAAPVVIGILWVGKTIPPTWQAPTLAGVALAVVVAGFVSRAWPVAIASVAFTFAAFLGSAPPSPRMRPGLPDFLLLRSF